MSEQNKHSVLIVDDDEDIRSNMRDILEEFGYETCIAEDGTAAIQAMNQRSFDIALVDYKMPGMDGAMLSDQIRVLSPKTVTIMVTAFAGSDGATKAKDAGTWKVLRKPVDVGQLIEEISSVVQKPLVLVVDDDAEFCTNLWEILREREYRVATAESEEEAIAVVESAPCDVAIVDLRLGNGDGRTVISRLRNQHATAKVIVVSGFIDELNAADSLWACLRKPVDTEQLLQIVANATKANAVD